jgi:hypothetical protein
MSRSGRHGSCCSFADTTASFLPLHVAGEYEASLQGISVGEVVGEDQLQTQCKVNKPATSLLCP